MDVRRSGSTGRARALGGAATPRREAAETPKKLSAGLSAIRDELDGGADRIEDALGRLEDAADQIDANEKLRETLREAKNAAARGDVDALRKLVEAQLDGEPTRENRADLESGADDERSKLQFEILTKGSTLSAAEQTRSDIDEKADDDDASTIRNVKG